MPYYVYIIIGAAILVLLLVVAFIIFKKKKNPNSKIKVDDEFINNLIGYLGEIKNVNNVNVDNGRLKIEVNDLDMVKLDEIKSLALNGVFVTGNVIKILFKYDSNTIKKAIDARL